MAQCHQICLWLYSYFDKLYMVLLLSKEADDIMYTFLVNVYSKFGGLHKILPDNWTEFRNTLLVQDVSILGMK